MSIGDAAVHAVSHQQDAARSVESIAKKLDDLAARMREHVQYVGHAKPGTCSARAADAINDLVQLTGNMESFTWGVVYNAGRADVYATRAAAADQP